MKLFKFGIIICSILTGISVVGLGSSLGKLYNETNLVYEFDLKEELKAEALNKIYIDSDIPVRIEETDGMPRVEFATSMTGVSIPEPRYVLDVRMNDDTTYIDMNRERVGVQMMFSEESEEMIIYLPKQAIDKLEIRGRGYWSNHLTYSGHNDIRSLKVENLSDIEVELNGNYNDVEISAEHGSLAINSHTPMDLKGQGLYEVALKGKYSDIELVNSGNIEVDSQNPCNIEIRDYQYGHGDISLEGEFVNIELERAQGEIEILPTIQPKIMKIKGDSTEIKMALPEINKGFEVIYNTDEGGYGEALEFYTNLEVDRRPVGEYKESISYGEKGTIIQIEGYYNNLSIIQ